jgi:hypothetical protein
MVNDGRRTGGTRVGLDGTLRPHGVSDAHDGLPAGFEFTRQGGDAGSFVQPLRNVSALVLREARRPSKRLTFGFCSAQAGLRALDQEIAFELGHGVDDGHRQLAGRTGEIDPAQGKAMNPDSDIGELGDGAADIHGVAAEAIKLGDHQHVAGFEFVEKAGEPAALGGGDAPRDRLGDDPARFDIEAGGRDLLDLVLGRLTGGRDTYIGEGTRHGGFSSGKDVRKVLAVRNDLKLIFGQAFAGCPNTNDSGQAHNAADECHALDGCTCWRPRR